MPNPHNTPGLNDNNDGNNNGNDVNNGDNNALNNIPDFLVGAVACKDSQNNKYFIQKKRIFGQAYTPSEEIIIRQIPNEEVGYIVGIISNDQYTLINDNDFLSIKNAEIPHVSIGNPLPLVQVGDTFVSSSSNYYVIQKGLRTIPDIETLTFWGFDNSKSKLITDDILSLPHGLPYFPIAKPCVLQSETTGKCYVYNADNTRYRQPIDNNDTIVYYGSKFGRYTATEQEIDKIPFKPEDEFNSQNYNDDTKVTEVKLRRDLVITGIRCLKKGHSMSHDTVELRACIDRPADAFTDEYYNTSQLTHTDFDNNSYYGGKELTRIRFNNNVSLGFKLPDCDTMATDNNDLHLNGYLQCEGELNDFDDSSAPVTLKYSASVTSAFDRWTTQYEVEAHVEMVYPCVKYDFSNYSNIDRIKHFFVILMENRSFDHILGANKNLQNRIKDADLVAKPENKTGVLDIDENNRYSQNFVNPYTDADHKYPFPIRTFINEKVLPTDPGHEIFNVLTQLVGQEKTDSGNALDNNGSLNYDSQSNSGFLDSYKLVCGNPELKDSNGNTFLPPITQVPPSESPSDEDLVDPRLKILECYIPSQAPIITKLADSFLVCNNWFASVPGPTWPNRFFAHCGTSGGISTSVDENRIKLVDYISTSGFQFDNGSIFNQLNNRSISYRIYNSNPPQVWAINGVSPFNNMDLKKHAVVFLILNSIFGTETLALLVGAIYAYMKDPIFGYAALLPIAFIVSVITGLSPFIIIAEAIDLYIIHKRIYDEYEGVFKDFDTHFSDDLSLEKSKFYSPRYTFIEPNQDINLYIFSPADSADSEHPVQSILSGEQLIREIYTTLRRSSIWEKSALIVTYDEHGGLYDHVKPPQNDKYAPGDSGKYRHEYDDPKDTNGYHNIFNFKSLGVRVPAIVISPYTSMNKLNNLADPKKVTTSGIYSEICDHSTIVKTLQDRFRIKPYLTNRVANTGSLKDVFGKDHDMYFDNSALSADDLDSIDLSKLQTTKTTLKGDFKPSEKILAKINTMAHINYLTSISDASFVEKVGNDLKGKTDKNEIINYLNSSFTAQKNQYMGEVSSIKTYDDLNQFVQNSTTNYNNFNQTLNEVKSISQTELLNHWRDSNKMDS